jgi:hypothetical protein
LYSTSEAPGSFSRTARKVSFLLDFAIFSSYFICPFLSFLFSSLWFDDFFCIDKFDSLFSFSVFSLPVDFYILTQFHHGSFTVLSQCRVSLFIYFLFIYLFSPLLLWWVGVHCGISQVLTMYRLYHTWIHLLYHSLGILFKISLLVRNSLSFLCLRTFSLSLTLGG